MLQTYSCTLLYAILFFHINRIDLRHFIEIMTFDLQLLRISNIWTKMSSIDVPTQLTWKVFLLWRMFLLEQCRLVQRIIFWDRIIPSNNRTSWPLYIFGSHLLAHAACRRRSLLTHCPEWNQFLFFWTWIYNHSIRIHSTNWLETWAQNQKSK